jgi:hypothetical protein
VTTNPPPLDREARSTPSAPVAGEAVWSSNQIPAPSLAYESPREGKYDFSHQLSMDMVPSMAT